MNSPLDVHARREVSHARKRPMEDGHILLQTPNRAYRLGGEAAAIGQEIEHVLAMRPHDPSGGAKSSVDVPVGRQAEGFRVHAPLFGLAGAGALQGAAVEDGLWGGWRRGSAAAAHSRSSSQAMIWDSKRSAEQTLGPRIAERCAGQ
jgi:hypothetical protein